MKQKKIEAFESKLLVEGNDDFHVVSAICQKFLVAETFGIKDCTGIEKLFDEIPIRIKTRDKNLGILIDADINIEGRWQQIVNILRPFNYIIPENPSQSGSIVYSDSFETVIGIWIMPNNRVIGMLENFARILIPENDVLIIHAEKIISELQELKVARFSDIHKAKALIHTWLAWQESPGTPMGLALTKSYLNHNHELCLLFVAWLNQLFNPNVIG